MQLLHVYRPEIDQAERQAATWRELEGAPFAVRHVPTPAGEPFAYGEALADAWHGGDPLVLLEGDKVPSLATIQRLASCPGQACAQAYRIYPRTTRLPAPVYAHRTAPMGLDGPLAWIGQDDGWADLVGFGLVKFGPVLLQLRPAWDSGPWVGLDTRVSRWTYRLGVRWHIHWPEIPHNHS